MDDESIAFGWSNDEGRPGVSYQGVDGSGGAGRSISPDLAANEAELEQVYERASQVALRLLGLTVQAAAAEVARTPALHIRFIEEGGLRTEDYSSGRITALTVGNVVTEASAG